MSTRRASKKLSMPKFNRQFSLSSSDFVKKMSPDLNFGKKFKPEIGKKFWTSIGRMWNTIYTGKAISQLYHSV